MPSRVEESLSDQITYVRDLEILMDSLGDLSKVKDKVLFKIFAP